MFTLSDHGRRAKCRLAKWQTTHGSTAGQKQTETPRVEGEGEVVREELRKDRKENQQIIRTKSKDKFKKNRGPQDFFVYFLSVKPRSPEGPVTAGSTDMPAAARVQRFSQGKQRISRAQIVLRSE